MRHNQRSIKNMFVQPRFQLKLSLYFVVVGGAILTAVGLFIIQTNISVQAQMNTSAIMDLRSQSQINEMLRQCVEVAMLGFLSFVIYSFFFALLMSHRIAGPQVAIKAYLNALKEGNYDYERNLRPSDELTEVMDAVKELKLALKERYEATVA